MKLFESTNHTEYYVNRVGDIFKVNTLLKEKKYVLKKNTINKKRGYAYVRTSKRNYLVHRLVAIYFSQNPSNKPQVNHIDSNRSNNNINNLEWVTAKENTQHAIKAGRIVFNKNTGNLKYTNEQCLIVINNVKKGMSYKEAGSDLNMPYSTVAHLMRGSRRSIEN